MLRYLNGTLDYGLLFSPTTEMTLEGYVDADWASSLDDRNPQQAIVFILVET